MKSNYQSYLKNLVYYFFFLPSLLYLGWLTLSFWVNIFENIHLKRFSELTILVFGVVICQYSLASILIVIYDGLIPKIGITHMKFWRAFYLWIISFFLSIATVIVVIMQLDQIISWN